MEIPDCYEAYRQEDARQNAWDIYLSKLPVCDICGEKIHEGYPVHEHRGKCVCGDCMDALFENQGFVEVDT